MIDPSHPKHTKWKGPVQLSILLAAAVVLLFLQALACQRRNVTPEMPDHEENYKETMMNVNKKLVRQETELIDAFIARYNWKMVRTSSGLSYMIYSKGNGKVPQPGDLVRFNYTVSLLSGDTCYVSSESGPRAFVVGSSGAEKGLDEGIQLMQVGDKAKFILPSHLAFGLLGDGQKIPQKAILVYDVELIEIKDLSKH